jgi:hypothetical protein
MNRRAPGTCEGTPAMDTSPRFVKIMEKAHRHRESLSLNDLCLMVRHRIKPNVQSNWLPERAAWRQSS